MVSNLAKVAIGVTGVASVGATAVYLSTSKTEEKKDTQKETVPPKKVSKKISEWINEKQKKTIIDKGANEKWTPKWTSFKEDYEKINPEGKGDWTIESWTTNKEEDKGLNAFKKLCEDNSNKEVDDIEKGLFTEVVKYCVE